MPKTKISEFSATPANNTDIDSINIAEGCAPSGINDAIRELMAQLKDFQTGAVGDSFNGPVGTTTAAAGAFTTLSSTGNTTLGDASGDSVTINGTATFANANPTLSAGTANGVAYLNGSKVVTSGSALTFDGTNFGIGAATALKPLDISFAGTSGARRFLASYDDSVITIKGANASNDPEAIRIIGDNIRFNTGTSGSGSEGMRLTSTGLGIGTSSPTTKLTVQGSTGGKNFEVISTGSASYSYNTVGATSSVFGQDSTGTLVADLGTKPLYFYVNGAERMRLDSSGNLGLGVTPSGWFSGTKAIQLVGSAYTSTASTAYLYQNGYLDSSTVERYYANGYASKATLNSGGHQWFTAPSGTAGNAITFTQAMTLDASGNLGVGVTSPATRLEVNGVSEGEYFRAGGGTISARSLQFSSFTVSGLSGVGHQINVPNASGVLTFATGSTERARIDSSGNLLLGTTTASLGPTSGFNVIIGGGVTGTSIGHVTGSSSGSYYELFAYNGSAIGSITQSGTTAVLYNTTSDQRLKENIQDADSASTLIDALQVRQFDWKADNSHQRYGFVAQELVTVAPEAVHQPEDTEQMMAVDYSKLVPMLVKEVQALRQRVAQLEAQ